MDFQQLGDLILILVILLFGALFSSLEIATVSISEYRLKSLVNKYYWAKCAYKLKSELNQVFIFSQFGNSLANTAFTTFSSFIIASNLSFVDKNLMLPFITIIIALIIIIFSESLPKVIAAKSPILTLTLISIPAYYIFIMSRPIIWTIDMLIVAITKLLRVKAHETTSVEDVKAIIADKRTPFKDKHRLILLNSIELEVITVKEVLIPIRMVEAINMYDEANIIYHKIYTTHHTRILVYDGSIDNVIGYIHTKDILSIDKNEETKKELYKRVRSITFINDFIPIIKQIHHAQKYKNRIFVVVNEYGDISGIACLEDMLETVFGDFTTESLQQKYLVIQNDKNQLIVDGTMLIRELNELYGLHIELQKDALTINGLVQKTLHGIPNIGLCFKLKDLIFEIINVGDYWVERVKITQLKSEDAS